MNLFQVIYQLFHWIDLFYINYRSKVCSKSNLLRRDINKSTETNRNGKRESFRLISEFIKKVGKKKKF